MTYQLSPEDADMLKRLLSRDRRSVIEFYTQHSQSLIQFIQSKIGDEQDREELVQDVLFAFLEGLRDFTASCSLKTYLMSIAKHKVIDYYRKKKIAKVLFSQLPFGAETLISQLLGPEETFDHQQRGLHIAAVFKKLKPQYALMLKLKYIEEKSVEEIARAFSCSFKSAESLLFRARKAFISVYSESSISQLSVKKRRKRALTFS